MTMRGFTMLEVVLYLALFSLLMTGTIASAIALGERTSSIDGSSRLTDEAIFLLERLRLSVEYGGIVSLPAPGSSDDRLVITGPSGERTYFLEGQVLMETDGASTTPLTNKKQFRVEELTFTHHNEEYAGDESHNSIEISLTLAARDRQGKNISRSFTQRVLPLNQLIEL